jgi:hypothetical protein
MENLEKRNMKRIIPSSVLELLVMSFWQRHFFLKRAFGNDFLVAKSYSTALPKACLALPKVRCQKLVAKSPSTPFSGSNSRKSPYDPLSEKSKLQEN